MTASTNHLLTIGQTAHAAGVAATTLRYYERLGILRPTARKVTGYRLYERDAVSRLQFIRSAQAVGFTLEDIGALLKLDCKDGKHCQSQVRRLLDQRLADVDRKLTELKRVRAGLRRALDRCRGSKDECAVLKELSLGSKKETKP